MKAVVVHCHPVEGSFCSALRDAAVRGLSATGCDVTVLDLAHEEFHPVMSRAEWETYRAHDGAKRPDAQVIPVDISAHVAAVLDAEILVFTYPTWWSSIPAQLKGWLERVMMPGVGFRLVNGRVRPGLTNIRHLVVITTYGSPWSYVKAINDNGRRTLLRALRLSTGWRTRRTHLGLYRMDLATDGDRAAFVAKVERRVLALATRLESVS